MPLSFLFAQHGVLFPCLQRGLFPCLQLVLFPCLLPDGASLQHPGLQRLPDGAPFRQVAFLAGACCRARFPRSSAAPPGQQHLCHCGAPASSSSRWLSATVPPSSSPWHSRPAAPPWHFLPAVPLRRPCQQQTSSGGEKYSGLASNLAHLGRIC